MPENESKIVRKKLLNITEEMNEELKLRVRETRRSEMQVIQDAVMGRMMFSPRAETLLKEYAKERGLSLERAFDLFLTEMWDFVQQQPKLRSKKR